ncbi:MAG TPA: hypothetical protein VGF57_06465 [Roseiarcus sp.]
MELLTNDIGPPENGAVAAGTLPDVIASWMTTPNVWLEVAPTSVSPKSTVPGAENSCADAGGAVATAANADAAVSQDFRMESPFELNPPPSGTALSTTDSLKFFIRSFAS